MSVDATVRGAASALDLALAPRAPEAVARFLRTVAPQEVVRAVQQCLPPGGADPDLRLIRAKLKPGRKLTAEYAVALPQPGAGERRVAVSWVAAGATAPGPAADEEADARRRGVLAPFLRSWAGSDDRRRSLTVSPVDAAFPQLVRLHDRVHLADVLRTVTGSAVAAADLTVDTVRFRPGQRHVLRVGGGPSGPAWFLKVYRDDTGRRAVHAAARVATAFAAAGNGMPALCAASGTYVASDRAAVWAEVTGPSLAEVIVLSGAATVNAVRAAGRGLRLLHDLPVGEALPACPGAAAQAAETVRTAELLEALAPAVGAQLRREVDRVLDLLARLPVEPPTSTHGDVKCDNLLVSGSGVHLLDFDRCGRGDPAADIGKFLADLRWWAAEGGHAVAPLHQAFLDAYGVAAPTRVARARAYDALLQLRIAARRIRVQDPAWADRVTGAVGTAGATLDGESS